MSHSTGFAGFASATTDFADAVAVLAPIVAYPALVLVLEALPTGTLAPLRATRMPYNLAQSLYAACVVGLVLAKLLRHDRLASVHALVCVASPGTPIGYYASKWIEMYDGVLVVAAGKSPNGLQVRHHSLAPALVAMHTAGRAMPSPLYDLSVLANGVVHTVMYLYFAFPRALAPLRRTVTSLQIAQFLLVAAAIVLALGWPVADADATNASSACDAPQTALGVSLLIYTLFVVDFLKFYMSAYPPTAALARVKGE